MLIKDEEKRLSFEEVLNRFYELTIMIFLKVNLIPNPNPNKKAPSLPTLHKSEGLGVNASAFTPNPSESLLI